MLCSTQAKKDSPPLSCTLSFYYHGERKCWINSLLTTRNPEDRTIRYLLPPLLSFLRRRSSLSSLPLFPSRRDEEEIIQTRQRNNAFGYQDLRTGPETSPPRGQESGATREGYSNLLNEDKERISMPLFSPSQRPGLQNEHGALSPFLLLPPP